MTGSDIQSPDSPRLGGTASNAVMGAVLNNMNKFPISPASVHAGSSCRAAGCGAERRADEGEAQEHKRYVTGRFQDNGDMDEIEGKYIKWGALTEDRKFGRYLEVRCGRSGRYRNYQWMDLCIRVSLA